MKHETQRIQLGSPSGAFGVQQHPQSLLPRRRKATQNRIRQTRRECENRSAKTIDLAPSRMTRYLLRVRCDYTDADKHDVH